MSNRIVIQQNSKKGGIRVLLEDKFVGRIRKVDGGYKYFPKGQKTGGLTFPCVGTCAQSLEDEKDYPTMSKP